MNRTPLYHVNRTYRYHPCRTTPRPAEGSSLEAAVGHDQCNRTPNIFLSYRREDTGAFALSLGDRLKHDLRLENVFLDVRDVFGGDDWRRVIADRIAASDAVIALIGPRWAGPRADSPCRIFDDNDVVRWELGHALRILPSHVVPTMLNGARLPTALPRELTPLYHVQRLDLRPPDSPECYNELLADVFMKAYYRRGRPIIITDGSDHAEAHLDRLAHQLKSGQLGMHGVAAVTAVTRGFAAISLREASAHWPDVIILRHPGADDEKLAALARGARRNALEVVYAGVIGATGGVTFELARSLIQPPPTPDPLLGPEPSASPTPSTSASPSSATPPATPPAVRQGRASPTRRRRHQRQARVTSSAKTGLGLAAKLAAAGLVTVAVAAGATLVISTPAPLSPPTAAPTSTTQQPAPGTGTPQPGGPSTGKRPSIMPTECSTDPFWGTNGHQNSPKPGSTLNCGYDYRRGTAFWPFSSIEVFDGTTPLPTRAQETKSGQKVSIEGTDAAWILYKPADGVSHILISSADESLFIIYHGNSADGIKHAKLLLRPS
jgi:hypothetical protein